MLDPTAVVYFLAATTIAFLLFLVWRTRIMFLLMSGIATATLIFWGGWMWVLRDGMGPDAVESHGVAALLRFTDYFWLPASVWLALIGAGLMLLRRRRGGARAGASR